MNEITKVEVAALARAITKVEAGWTRGTMQRRHGATVRYCMAGAIHASAHTRTTRMRLRGLLCEIIEHHDGGEYGITGYNDTRKKSEVLAVMREALAEAKKLAGVA